MKKLEDFFIDKHLASQPLRGSQHSAVNHLVDAVSTSMERTSSPEAFLNNLFTALKSSPGPHPSDQDTDLDDTPASHPSAQDADLDADAPPADAHDTDLDSVVPPSSEHDSMQDEAQDPPLVGERPPIPEHHEPATRTPPQDTPLNEEQPPIPEHHEPATRTPPADVQDTQEPIQHEPKTALKESELSSHGGRYKFRQKGYIYLYPTNFSGKCPQPYNCSFKIMKVHKTQHTYLRVANLQGSVHNLPLHPELNDKPRASKDGQTPTITWETTAAYHTHDKNVFTEGEVQFEQHEKARSKFLNALLEAFKANAKIPKRKYREAQAKVNQKIAK